MFKNPILNELVNKYREKKLAHAYLIETNKENQALIDLMTLIKIINCPKDYEEDCTKCNLCHLITKNNLPSIKIIEPIGNSIKKSQIEELKESFTSIPIYSKYNIYIIKSADKLNSSSANTMLKFLEEPTEGIIGFFLTNNKDIMIDTIKSRCQSIVLNYEINSIQEKLQLTEEQFSTYKEEISKYLSKLDKNEMINNKNEILNTFPDRGDINNFFQILLEIYYQNFLKKINKEYDKKIVEIYELKENKEILIKKLNIIIQKIQDLSYNVNIEQILDKFVIEMRGSNG